MGFRNIGEIIAGFIATRPDGRRIEIDGTGDTYDQIRFFSGQPDETAPGTLGLAATGPGGAGLYMQANKVTGGAADPTYLSLTSGGIYGAQADLVSGGNLTISSAGRMAVGPSGVADLSLSAGAKVLVEPSGDVVLNPLSGQVNMPAGVHLKRGALSTATLVNGWTAFGSGFQAPAYAELPDNTGVLSGVASGGTITGQTALFTLPAAVRPAAHHVYPAACNSGLGAQIVVRSDGEVRIQSAATGVTWVSLSGMAWPIAGF